MILALFRYRTEPDVPSKEVEADLVVNGARHALAISKSNESSNEPRNPAFYTTSNANLPTSPTYALVDEHKQT